MFSLDKHINILLFIELGCRLFYNINEGLDCCCSMKALNVMRVSRITIDSNAIFNHFTVYSWSIRPP